MQLEYRQLSGDEIQEGLKSVSGWAVQGECLMKEFSFDTYMTGAEFVQKVAETSESLDHHPEIELSYKKVRITVNTHSVGGLSPYDFELARRLDQIA